MIAEKLDFLMRVTDTRNSALARALNFDASYISRIRGGKRGLPKNQPFLAPAAAYFARRLRDAYQRGTAAAAVCPGQPWPGDQEQAELLLLTWLSRDETVPPTILPPPPYEPTVLPHAGAELRCYYGNAGKREAVLTFLNELYGTGLPYTLLLCSDEDMTWLYEDSGFVRSWTALMLQLISRGSRVRIIHTVSRASGEMMEAIRKWIPLYVSGAIESYYYPKLRDGIFRRTLFIAQGCSAVTSCSVGEQTEQMLNLLLRDPAAVRALELEFQAFFSRCKPLMQLYQAANRDGFWLALTEFERADADWIIAQSVPTIYTMPESAAQSMARRSGGKRLLARHAEAVERFRTQLARGRQITEVMRLPEVRDVRERQAVIPLSELFGSHALSYTVEEYRAQLQNMLRLLREEPGYHLALVDQFPQGLLLHAKEDVGSLLATTAPSVTAAFLQEPRLNAACWAYLRQMADDSLDRAQTIRTLERCLQLL